MKDLIQTLKYLEENTESEILDNYYLENTTSVKNAFEETLAGYLSSRMNSSRINDILKNSNLLSLVQQFDSIKNERVDSDDIVQIQKALAPTLDAQFNLVDKIEQIEMSNLNNYSNDDIRQASMILQSSIEIANRFIKSSEDYWNSPENREVSKDLLDPDPRPHGMSNKDFF